MFPTRIRCPGPSRRVWESVYLTFAPYVTAKNFVHAIFHPDPARRLTAEQTLSDIWLTSLATLTKHDLCDMREKVDHWAYWHDVIGLVRTLLRAMARTTV